jgi:LCP family protein required for cell wall assembly
MLRNKLFLLCALLFGISMGLSVAAYNWQRDFWATESFTKPLEFATPTPRPGVTRQPVQEIFSPKSWDGTERVNILALGIDQREGEEDTCYRTDTMIVVTIDPVTKQAGMLSVPRDTWVNIPGYETNRINVANCLGDTKKFPGGGSALAKKTVENFLGIPIHFTARVNFTAFENIVDRIGGVEIDVENDIYDPEYPTSNYGVEVFQLSKGKQVLDGATALKFARTRHNLKNGDFDRARNQQKVILAVREKLKSPAVLASLLTQAPILLNELSASVKTDMTLDQMQQLVVLGTQLDRNRIKMAVLDQNYTDLTITPQGWAVQIPNRVKIAELRESLFSTNSASMSINGQAAKP